MGARLHKLAPFIRKMGERATGSAPRAPGSLGKGRALLGATRRQTQFTKSGAAGGSEIDEP
jgi:hypothetical protein